MSFKFQNNTCVIEIEQHRFEVQVGSIEVLEALAMSDAAAGEHPPAGEGDPSGVKNLCRLIGRRLDQILGLGAYDRIFAGRPLNLRDHLDVMTYITGEMTRFTEEREKALLGRNQPPAVEGHDTVM